MNVLAVGLLSMALYAVVLALWLRQDRNVDDYNRTAEEDVS